MTPPATPDVDVAALLALVEQVAREAGALALRARRQAVDVTATKSSPTDVVTAADTAAERLVRTRVADLRPHDAVVGEEGDDQVGSSGLTWVVDPIDGTVNFLYDIPRWATAIAVEDAAGPLVAVVHAPALGETYTAVRGGGARRDGDRVAPSDCDRLEAALVATGFGYRAERRARQAAVVAEVLPRVRDIRRFGAASLDLCDVACGRLDGYYEQGLQPWDLAAGSLVVAEAGGLVSGLGGRPASERLTVAAAPRVHGPLVDLLTALAADRFEPET